MKETGRIEVTKIDKKTLPASDFEYPPTYAVIDIDRMFPRPRRDGRHARRMPGMPGRPGRHARRHARRPTTPSSRCTTVYDQNIPRGSGAERHSI